MRQGGRTDKGRESKINELWMLEGGSWVGCFFSGKSAFIQSLAGNIPTSPFTGMKKVCTGGETTVP